MDRVRRTIAHPLLPVWVAVLIAAEVLLFVLLSFQTASDLWFSVLAIWFLIPVVVMFASGVARGRARLTPRSMALAAVALALPVAIAVLGFVAVFNHQLTTEVLVFQARKDPVYYGRYGGDTSYQLQGSDGTWYDVTDDTGDDWDPQHFGATAKLEVSYRCEVLTSPAQRRPQVYDCGRLDTAAPSSPSPAGAAGTVPASPSTHPVKGWNLQTMSYSGFGGASVKLELDLPPGASISQTNGFVSVTDSRVSFQVDVDDGSARSALEAASATHISLKDGVLEGSTPGFAYFGKNIPGGSLVVMAFSSALGGVTFPYADVVRGSSATLG
jgi:hypothetical protein